MMSGLSAPESGEASARGLQLPEHVRYALRGAASARGAGRLTDAITILAQAMTAVQTEPFGTPFNARVQLGLTLAEAHLDAGDHARARQALLDEAGYCEQIIRLLSINGTPEQRRAASAGRMQVRDRLVQIELIGLPAPEIVIQDWAQGEAASLAALRGRVVLLEFWATWCRPCLDMFPRLKELHERHAERGLEIIALTHYASVPVEGDASAAQARERELVRTVVADRELDVRVGIAPDGRLQARYGAHGVPTLALIGRDGRVRAILSGGAEDELDAQLLTCLNEPAPQDAPSGAVGSVSTS